MAFSRTLSFVLLVASVPGCEKIADKLESATTTRPAATAPAPVAPPPAPAQPATPQVKTLPEAIAAIKPLMDDTFNESSKGGLLLAAWAAKYMTWKELNQLPPTKFALVMKDPDEERGKLICARGSIIEISVEKSPLGKFNIGGMFSGSNIYRFITVGSSGELVAQSWAGLCGVVIGKQTYSNSMGGTAHAVFVVGMFNLPQNKK